MYDLHTLMSDGSKIVYLVNREMFPKCNALLKWRANEVERERESEIEIELERQDYMRKKETCS